MKKIRYNSLKSGWLKLTRGVSFEEILQAKLIHITKSQQKKNQRIFLFVYNNYVWAVPFVKNGDEIFLKTLYPSRKYTKIYLRRIEHEKN